MNRSGKNLVALLVTAVALAGLTPALASAKATISASGSTSEYPLMVALAKAYAKANPGKVQFKLVQGGSDVGINDVAKGRVTLGMSSRDPKPTDPGGISFNKVARDALCIVTNKSNPVSNLSQEQASAIFSGKTRDWSDVTGAKASGPINIVVRTAASGTQDAFQLLFMGSNVVSSSASFKATNGLVQQAVKSDKSAIGYVSLDFAGGLNNVAYKGVGCNLRNAKSGQYGGTRNFWMITRGKPSGATAAFIKWAQNSPKAQSVAATHWVPLKG